MNLWEELSPETKKSAVRIVMCFVLYTLLISIAIGMAGGLIIAEIEKPHQKGGQL
ncbi:hypothetical protein HYV71_04575 [Candidatus Uhrbacteria bacterium]|nr:hypothetical protein [Candidatus Uhrbacteria bacterium]